MTDSPVETVDSTAGVTTDSLVVDIVERLAVATGIDPLDLPPLNDYADMDAIAALFRPAAGRSGLFGIVTFRVEDHEVRVYHDGTIYVQRASDVRPAMASSTSF